MMICLTLIASARSTMTQYRILRMRWLAFTAGVLLPIASSGEVYRLPAQGNDLIGEIRYTTANDEDTLIDIARENSLGQDEIVMANPDVDRWMPRGGTKVLIPRQFILPEAPRVGVVLNIPEMRLYYYPGEYETVAAKPAAKPVAAKSGSKGKEAKIAKNPKNAAKPTASASRTPAQPTVVMKGSPTQVITFPVSIGRMDWRTPLGAARIAEKVKDPVWRPPETIKKEHAQDGDILPDVVPAGPNNPLGQFAMRLSVPGYLIHGTGVDKAYGIGMRVTHGCIRMYPEDIAKLFPLVNVGTPVRLVNQPIKLGWEGNDLYMEVHQPLDEDRMSYDELLSTALGLIEKKNASRGVLLSGGAIRKAIEKPSGVPVLISRMEGIVQPLEASESSRPPMDASEPRRSQEPAALPETAPEPEPAPGPVQDAAAIPEYPAQAAPEHDPSAAPDADEEADLEEGI